MADELILLVDDEPNIIQLARMYLERDGFQVQAVGDGEAALAAILQDRPALVVLDVMLPKMDGFAVCRHLREEKDATPILMLTARDDDIDKIVGLEIGADDYLTKPFNPRELVARVKAILRRGQTVAEAGLQERLHIGDLLIVTAAREVSHHGENLPLRAQEFDLLMAFVRHKGQVLTREQLLQQAWGYEYFGNTRTVDVHIAHLRKKLTGSAVKIETVIGVGYKLVA